MKWFLLFWLMVLSGSIRAGSNPERSPNQRKAFLSAGFSAVAYKGSLQSSYFRWTPAYQAGIVLEKKKLFSSYLGLGIGTYIAEDREYRLPSRADVNLKPATAIEGSFFTMHYEARFLLFSNHGWSIQACQGIGLFRFSVKDRDGNSLIDKPKSREINETYSQNSVFFPSSLLLQYRFPNQFGLGLQAGWLNCSSSYLDNMQNLAQNDTRDNLATVRFHLSLPLK
jgi:hypothetical protein